MSLGSIIIESDAVHATLDAGSPRLIDLNAIRGSSLAHAQALDLSDGSRHDTDLAATYAVSCGRNSAIYSAKAMLEGRPAVEYVLRFLAQNDRLTITCEFGEEDDGFQLMAVTVPLISVNAGDGSLALPIHGGRMVDIASSEPGEYVQRGTCRDLPLAAMLYRTDLATAALVELGSLDDNVVSSVQDGPGGRTATLSVRFTHRYGPQNPDVPTFRVTNRSDAFVTLFHAEGKHWWTNGARMLRERVRTSIPPLYDGAVIYKIKLDQPDFPEDEFTTFDQAIDRIRQIHNLTAGGRQIAYLNGWQHRGHDTGYPDVFTVNERVGGIDGLRRAIAAGPELNAVVSVHDNYDDAYSDSPAWDPDIIATDENGRPKAGGVWGGGQAYIISPHKYVDKARDRIRETAEMYGLSKTIHVDVFSVVPDRYDFDPANPAGFARSAEAKNYMIRAFRELGLDMTSEGICSAFVGNVNYGWHFPDSSDRVFSAEEEIPLLPFIYHGRVIGAGGVNDDRHLLKHLLWGLSFCADIRKKTDIRSFIDLYYLLYVPFFQLASRTMRSYESDGPVCTVRYDGNTSVTVNYDSNTYEAVVDGVTVARDFTTTCPLPHGGIAAYSRLGGELKVAVSADTGCMRVYMLTGDGRQEITGFPTSGQSIVLDAAPSTPYLIVLDRHCCSRASARSLRR